MKLNLGCGFRKLDGYLNIDIRDDVCADVVYDISTGLPYPDDSVDEVRAFDLLEHIRPDKVVFVMNEIWRVLRPGGTLEHLTPSTDGRGAFQDPTHRSFWNANSWLYYTDERYRRLVYGLEARFEVVQQEDKITGDLVIHTYGILRAVK